MKLIEQRKEFEKNKKIYKSTKLIFKGVDTLDVYNCSIPFTKNNKTFIYGRVEKRDEWANSIVCLFENSGNDEWTLVPDSMTHHLEDPYIAFIDEEIVLGGTHVQKQKNEISNFSGYFFRGENMEKMTYFTKGPDRMKDIRLVKMDGSKIGVFSRPRGEHILNEFGSESLIGFSIINSLDDLNADIITNAKIIPNLFDKDQWGGCNQAYFFNDGLIGVIGHKCYKSKNESGQELLTYMNNSFIFDPEKNVAFDEKIIGTRNCYPDGPAKKPTLSDCAFTSGIVVRENGKVDLYSGISDTEQGRIVIDNPFTGYTIASI
jgi:Protein of unknown function (DUF1861)